MNDFLPIPKLFQAILELNCNIGNDVNQLPPMVKDSNPPLSFPLLNQENISKIIRKLEENTKIVNIFKDIPWSYPFDISLSTKIMASFPIMLNIPKYTSTLILNTYISLIISENNSEHVSLIFELLKNIISQPNSTISLEIRHIAASAFASLYNFSGVIIRSPDISQYITNLRTFIVDNSDLPKSAFSLLTPIAQDVLDKKQMFETFIKNAEVIFTKCKNRFTIEDIDGFIRLICDPLVKPTVPAIHILAIIVQMTGRVSILPFVVSLPYAMKDMIISRKRKCIIDNTENLKLFKLEFNNNTQHRHKGSLLEGIPEFGNLPDFSLDKIEEFIDPDTAEFCQATAELLATDSQFPDTFIETVIMQIKNNAEAPFLLDLIAAYVFSLKLTQMKKYFVPKVGCFFTSVLFDPKMTIYSPLPHFKAVNAIRQEVATLIISNDFEKVKLIFDFLFNFPLVFSELIFRIIQLPDYMFNSIFITADYYVEIFKKSMNIELNEENKFPVTQLRLALLYLYEKFINVTYYADYLFEQKYFIETIFKYAANSKLTKFLLTNIAKYITGPTTLQSSELIHEIKANIHNVLEKPLTTPKLQEYYLEFLKLLNSIIIVKKFHIKNFLKTITRIVEKTADLPNAALSQQIISETLSIMISISENAEFSRSELTKLRLGIRRLYGDEPPFAIMHKILEIAKGTKINVTSEPFVVIRPSAINLLLEVFERSKHIYIILKYLKNLILSTPANKNMLHKGTTDIKLIDMIKEMKSLKCVDLAFEILKLISSEICSGTVVNRFISLFWPVEEKYRLNYQPQAINFITTMIDEFHNVPEIGYTLSTEPMQVQSLQSEMLSNSTLLAWFFVNNTENDIVLFSMADEIGTTVSINVINQCVAGSVTYNGTMRVGPSQIVCPVGYWFPMLVSFIGDPKNDKYEISFYLDEDNKKVQTFRMPPFKQGRALIQFSYEKNPQTFNGMVGPFGIFNALVNPTELLDLNVKQVPTRDDLIIWLNPVKEGDRVGIKAYPESKQYRIFHDPPLCQSTDSFLTILSTRIGISVLLPLYGELDMPFCDGSKFDNGPCMITFLLGKILPTCKTSQIDYMKNEGFSIIVHLLEQASPSNRTYELYAGFYNILPLLPGNVIVSFLSTIILNFELWMDSHDFAKITYHWANVVFTGYPVICNELYPIRRILIWLRSSIFYQPIEGGIIAPKLPPHSQEVISEIRRNILAAAEVLKNYVTTDDINLVINQIITNGEKMQTLDLLEFLTNIICDNNEIDYSHLPLLSTLVATLDYDIIIALLKAIKSINTVVKSFILDEQLGVIIANFPTCLITDEFFNKLYTVCLSEPSFFPLLAFFTCYDVNYCMTVYSKFPPSRDLFAKKFSSVYTCYAYCIYSQEIRADILEFIVKCGPSIWPNFYYMLDFVSRSLGLNTITISRDFVNKIANLFEPSPAQTSVSEADAFLEIIRSFLFTKPCNYVAPTMKTLGKLCQSTYGDQIEMMPDQIDSATLSSLHLSNDADEEEEKSELAPSPNVPPPPPPPQSSSPPPDGLPEVPPPPQATMMLSQIIRKQLLDSRIILKRPPSRKVSLLSPNILFDACRNIMRIKSSVANSKTFDAPYKLLISKFKQEMVQENVYNKIHTKLLATITKRRFGLMCDSVGHWMEVKLAELALDVFSYFMLRHHRSTAALICSYLLKTSSEKPYEIMKLPVMNIKLLPEHCIFNSFATKFNREILPAAKMPYSELMKNADLALSMIARGDACSNYAANYVEYIGILTRNALFAKDITHDPILNNMIEGSQELQVRNISMQHYDRKKWRKFWSRQTIKGYPWYNSVKIDTEQIQKKRLMINCAFNIPMKVKTVYARPAQQKNNVFYDRGDDTDENISQETQISVKKMPTVQEEFTCEMVTINATINITVEVCSDCLMLKRKLDPTVRVIKYKKIIYVMLKPAGKNYNYIEIYLNSGSSILLNMNGKKTALDMIYLFNSKDLLSLRMPVQLTSTIDYFVSTEYTKLWVTGRVSNFEYLMALNQFSGRTFQSLSQYPVMPWLLNNYDDAEIEFTQDFNLTKSKYLRDLSKPIGTINPTRLKVLARRAKDTKWLYEKWNSTPQRVCQYLARIQPFGSIAEVKRSSIQEEYKTSTEMMGNYEELIPEFFFMPEAFEGMKLPVWAKNSPFMFVYLHRKILESDAVSNELHRWIDLIFGNSRSDLNKFVPSIYDGTNPSIGIVPTQLFKSYHPPRKLAHKKQLKYVVMNPIYPDPKCMCVIKKDAEEITALYVDALGVVRSARHNAEKESSTLINEKQFEMQAAVENMSDSMNTMIPISPKKILIIGKKKDRVFFISLDSEKCKETKFHSNIAAYDFSNSLMAFALTDSMISIYKHSESMIFSVQLSAGIIETMAVSAIFHIIAVGTREGEIYIVSIISKNVTQILSLGSFICTKLVISRCWGFIVAFCEGGDNANLTAKVCVYTCNGELVTEYPIDRVPTCVCTYYDLNGFDYVICSNSNQEIYMFEAPFPNKMIKLCDKVGDCINLEPWGSRCILATIADGSIHVIPLPNI